MPAAQIRFVEPVPVEAAWLEWAGGCTVPGQCRGDKPVARPIQLSPDFWIGETETTREAYEEAMGSLPALRSAAHLELAPDLRGRLPVTHITPADAQEYCREVGLDLPTEFQWDFAARAGAVDAQLQPLEQFGWLASDLANSVNALLKTGEVTRLDAQKKPNAWGIFDRIGNAGEFATAAGDSSKIAIRGGSFVKNADQVKLWRRFLLPDLDTPYMDFGFRCAGPKLF